MAGLKLNPEVAVVAGAGVDVEADGAVAPLDPMLKPVLLALKMNGTGLEPPDEGGMTIDDASPPVDFLTSGLMAKMAEERLFKVGGAGEAVGVVDPKLKEGALELGVAGDLSVCSVAGAGGSSSIPCTSAAAAVVA